MTITTRQTPVYIATDGKEFETEAACRLYEDWNEMLAFHHRLMQCKFHANFKIFRFFHNREVTNIDSGPYNMTFLGSNLSYTLVHGRLGNGDTKVRYKKRGSNIIFLRYDTDGNKAVYLGKIPAAWMQLSDADLATEVAAFCARRSAYMEKRIADAALTPAKRLANKYVDRLNTMKENRSRWEEENWSDSDMQDADRLIALTAEFIRDLNAL